MIAFVSFGRSLVFAMSARSPEKPTDRTWNPRTSAGRRSATERPNDPQGATLPCPWPRLGVSGPSRCVPDGEATRGERKNGGRDEFQVAEGVIRNCREGERSSVMGEPPRGVSPPDNQRPARSPPCRTDDEPTNNQRGTNETDDARSVSGDSVGLWSERFDDCSGRGAGAWRSPFPEAPESPTHQQPQ